MAALTWVSDGVTGDERVAVNFLTLLNNFNPAATARILDMPFLNTFGPADVEALWSLARLAADEAQNGTDALTSVLDNPNLADGGGIDDNEARVVAVIGAVNQLNPELVEKLLDPSETNVTERRVQGQGRPIHLAIIRTAPGSASTMDLLEYAVLQSEIIMNEPLRTDYVGLLVEEIIPDFAARRFMSVRISRSRRGSTLMTAASTLAIGAVSCLAHEVAHYYWYNSALWIDEGAADFMAGVSEYNRVGRLMEPDNVPCSYYRSILHLELANPRTGSWGWGCNYALGRADVS